jgi:hypothetical protein
MFHFYLQEIKNVQTIRYYIFQFKYKNKEKHVSIVQVVALIL